MFNASVTGGHTFFLCNGTSYDSLIEVSDVTTEISFGFDDDSCRTVSGPSSITINSLFAVSCSWSQFELDYYLSNIQGLYLVVVDDLTPLPFTPSLPHLPVPLT